jgi:hypothetical protein
MLKIICERGRPHVNTVPPAVSWRRSSRCSNSQCVEVARIDQAFAIRDSKDLGGPVLTFPPAAWADFVSGVRAGEFDR